MGPAFQTVLIKRLLDLGFLELDVLACNRVVLGLLHLVRHRTAVLCRDVEEARVGRRQKLDLDGCCFRHGLPALNKRTPWQPDLAHGEFWRETTNRARKVKSFWA